MLGFDAIAALPIADDQLADADESPRIAGTITTGSTRPSAFGTGNEIIDSFNRGGTRIEAS